MNQILSQSEVEALRRVLQAQLAEDERGAFVGKAEQPLHSLAGDFECAAALLPLQDEERESNLKQIRQEIERLGEVTQRILTFSRPAQAPTRAIPV